MKDTNVRLVLMSCCAPCACGAIKQLADGQIDGVSDFIVLFYNPNIYPDTEYQKRLSEQIKYCDALGVRYAIGDYDHDSWLKSIRGNENAAERGARCDQCFRHRFRFAQNFAILNGYNAIASVFGVSKHKDQEQVDSCATDELTKVRYLPVNWDKNIKIIIERGADFYRQNYCGCEFSIRK